MENALAACEDPGVLTIECRECDCDGGPGLEIVFVDNGPGFADGVAGSIFQPFFTTKQKGTGLGLAIAKRIIESHGGHINVGQLTAGTDPGARISIRIPR